MQDKTTPLEGCHEWAGSANCAVFLHLLMFEKTTGIFLAVKWLRLHNSTAGGTGFNFWWGKFCMPCSATSKIIIIIINKTKKHYLIFILFPKP